jgi:uncharacterized protein (TIGR03118 family)
MQNNQFRLVTVEFQENQPCEFCGPLSPLLFSAASLCWLNSASVSDKAANIDGNLLNAWGLSRATTSPWWISDNGAGVSTLYDGAGVPQPTTTPQPLVVTIPLPPSDSSSGAATASEGKTSTPTGTVFNYTSGFEVAPGKKAIFLFVTEDGTISGWNPTVKPTEAVIKVNRSGKAVYIRLHSGSDQVRRVPVCHEFQERSN